MESMAVVNMRICVTFRHAQRSGGMLNMTTLEWTETVLHT